MTAKPSAVLAIEAAGYRLAPRWKRLAARAVVWVIAGFAALVVGFLLGLSRTTAWTR